MSNLKATIHLVKASKPLTMALVFMIYVIQQQSDLDRIYDRGDKEEICIDSRRQTM